VTGDHIAAMTTVLASGEVIHTGSNTVKNVAGLDLHRLLIGSEGTLGVIVEVVAKLMPRRVNAGTLIAFFPKLEGAGHAIVDLARPQNLSKLEVMDQTTIRAVDALMGLELDTDAAAMLIAQVDTVDAESILAACESSCETHGASLVYATDDEQEGRSFMRARSAALPALEKLGRWLLDDVAVPIPRIPDLLAYCERTAANAGIRIGTFGHAGDGNLHPTLVYNEDQESAAERAFDQIIAGALELGGTVTGEHGVGLLKRRHLASMLGARELELMRGIKHVFDPKGLLNPGKGF
ncbi:MAG: FAD-linked oxidase C-terminal domain-containing protein, partial [Myxococcota bacterium]